MNLIEKKNCPPEQQYVNYESTSPFANAALVLKSFPIDGFSGINRRIDCECFTAVVLVVA